MTRLYAANLAYTTLDLPISDASVTFTVTDPTAFPATAPFIIKCESELMLVGAIDKPTRTFSSITRAYEGTTAVAHAAGATVSNVITAQYWNELYGDMASKYESTGGTITGDVDIIGNISATGSLALTGNITIATSSASIDTNGGLLIDPVISGGVLLDAFDANDKVLGKPVIKNYKETLVALGNVGSSYITMDLSSGNVFTAQVNGDVSGIDITNASSLHANSLTLSLLSSGSTFSVAWMAPVSVTSASTLVSASTVDYSFNIATTSFSTQVALADIITVSGFLTTGTTANNDSFRVISATTAKIVCDSTAIQTAVATSNPITITRRQEFFTNATVPDAPTAYIPKDFTMWSYADPTRWRIAEVGEF